MLRQKRRQLFDDVPIVIIVKLIGVAPHIEQHREVRRAGQKLSCQLHQLRIIVVAGGIPLQKIFGNRERMGGADGSRTHVPRKVQLPDRLFGIHAEGIGKHTQRLSHQRLQTALILHDLIGRKRRADAVQPGMV